MPKKTRRGRACRGKEQLTRDKALKRAQRMNEELFANINAYFCGRCGFWHVGNNPIKPKVKR